MKRRFNIQYSIFKHFEFSILNFEFLRSKLYGSPFKLVSDAERSGFYDRSLRVPYKEEYHNNVHVNRAYAECGEYQPCGIQPLPAGLRGQILVVFIITVAAAEAAIGLAIIIALFRNKDTVHADEMSEMKG